jgi:hypothetical protein
MKVLTLIEAVKAGNGAAVQELINTNAPIDQTDDYGWTALNWAAGRGDAAIVQLLLNAGANIANTGRDNRTPYQIALAAARLDSALILQHAEQKTPANNPYCKAYALKTLRKFPDWSENLTAFHDDALVYLHSDLSVTNGIWRHEEVVFQSSLSAWQQFCREELAFVVPSDLALATAFVAEKTNTTQTVAL